MTAAGCPICGGPVARDQRPFCSRRCRDIDLQRWLSGRYVAPATDDDDDESLPDDEG